MPYMQREGREARGHTVLLSSHGYRGISIAKMGERVCVWCVGGQCIIFQ